VLRHLHRRRVGLRVRRDRLLPHLVRDPLLQGVRAQLRLPAEAVRHAGALLPGPLVRGHGSLLLRFQESISCLSCLATIAMQPCALFRLESENPEVTFLLWNLALYTGVMQVAV